MIEALASAALQAQQALRKLILQALVAVGLKEPVQHQDFPYLEAILTFSGARHLLLLAADKPHYCTDKLCCVQPACSCCTPTSTCGSCAPSSSRTHLPS